MAIAGQIRSGIVAIEELAMGAKRGSRIGVICRDLEDEREDGHEEVLQAHDWN